MLAALLYSEFCMMCAGLEYLARRLCRGYRGEYKPRWACRRRFFGAQKFFFAVSSDYSGRKRAFTKAGSVQTKRNLR
jgi:hypothetical protein